MDIRDEIYDLFTEGIDRNENRNLSIPDRYIIKRGHSPNGLSLIHICQVLYHLS